MPEWSIIIHGGAKTIEPDEEQSHQAAAKEAVLIGAEVLRRGGKAIDAVEASIKAMEDGGVFNAGQGSVIRSNGQMEMDASIMDGKTLEIGAMAGLSGIKNPISAARYLLTDKPVLLIGESANAYARAKGAETFEIKSGHKKLTAPCDTVGCVARDNDGNLAVGLSTGGLSDTMAGRVGDVPLPGCGFYADNARGALCFSGDGEGIARKMLAAEVMGRLKKMDPESAISDALDSLRPLHAEAGCILLDLDGNPFWGHISSHFAIAYQTSELETPVVALKK
ncbi:MAG: asparaginase [Micavibrio sp.]|nr:asparaginase [Micavibrio sp.]